MRLQWIVPCERRDGNVLHGTYGHFDVAGMWQGPTRPQQIPFKIFLAACLIEGSAGKHIAHFTIRPPKGQAGSIPPIEFEWPKEQFTHLVDINIDMNVPFIDGVWEFSMLVDGTPMGAALVPIFFQVRKAG